jgi:hypothetical protein
LVSVNLGIYICFYDPILLSSISFWLDAITV